MNACIRLLAASILAAQLASPALAHSEKTATTPADGAVLTAPPETVGMNFDMPMRVTLVRLTDGGGSEIVLRRSDGMAPVTEFRAAPPPLGAGRYTFEWRGLAEDGHAMQGSFSFEIGD